MTHVNYMATDSTVGPIHAHACAYVKAILWVGKKDITFDLTVNDLMFKSWMCNCYVFVRGRHNHTTLIVEHSLKSD